MTDQNKITQLLAAFYNGDTTYEEENILYCFFNSEDVSEKYHTDRDLFRVLYDPARIPLPEGLSVRLEAGIDNHIAGSANLLSHVKTRRLLISILSAAAVILLCAGLFFIPKSTQNHSDFIADTYTNPEEAAIKAEQALIFISSKLNEGLAPLEKVKESVNKTNDIINQNFKLYK